ncbi:uncharacterized protein LOC117116999 [Anneissia japonica]|uniref:uncharacterized protein LOC117116999 n=1 Tax=Anneissia japonica TaxID=1529436 RepID=UPI0014257AB9|nr:uncharacterized protein LOC117116999 [Anneissia japonica]
MRRINKILLLLLWKYSVVNVVVTRHCPPEFVCSRGSTCYLIYTVNGEWNYKYSDSAAVRTGEYSLSKSCYKFIPQGLSREQSCYDAQLECQHEKGNITFIDNIQEYNQLVDIVLYILYTKEDSYFNVNTQEMCAKVTIQDGILENSDMIKIKDRNEKQNINSIMCEATGTSTGTYKGGTNTDTESYFTKVTLAISTPGGLLEDSSPTVVSILAPLIVVMILIAILSVCIYRRMRKRNCCYNNPTLTSSRSIEKHQSKNKPGDGVDSAVGHLMGDKSYSALKAEFIQEGDYEELKPSTEYKSSSIIEDYIMPTHSSNEECSCARRDEMESALYAHTIISSAPSEI